ncbi:MAG: hypothetical protein R3C49_01615 [Planctomycetaceae bacterium]
MEASEKVAYDAFGDPVIHQLNPGGYTYWVRGITRTAGSADTYTNWGDAMYYNAPASTMSEIRPVIDGGSEFTSVNGIEHVVTLPQPTITWQAVHGTALYEVLVHRRDSKPPMVQTTTNLNSYTFASGIAEGSYTVWVRAIDTQGNFSSWSAPFAFFASGGKPILTSPQPGDTQLFPQFTWAGVRNFGNIADPANAVSYEVWIAQETDPFQYTVFNYLNVKGIKAEFFNGAAPLVDGNYRVWVRALLPNGTFSPWSNPVRFIGSVVRHDDSVEQRSLVRLDSPNITTEPPDDSGIPLPETPPVVVTNADCQNEIPAPGARDDLPGPLIRPVSSESAQPDLDSLIQDLAGHCENRPWWEDSEVS